MPPSVKPENRNKPASPKQRERIRKLQAELGITEPMPHTMGEASDYIASLIARKNGHSSSWSAKSKRGMIRDTLRQYNLDTDRVYSEFMPWVAEQRRPMIFSLYDGTGQPKPYAIAEQYVRLQNMIETIARQMRAEDVIPTPAPAPEPTPEPEPDVTPEPDPDYWPVPEPAAPPAEPVEMTDEEFLAIVFKAQDYSQEQQREGNAFPEVTYRIITDGRKMRDVGLPWEYVLHAYFMTWPDEAKRDVGIPVYDVTKLYDYSNVHPNLPGEHVCPEFPILMKLAEAGVNIALVGPSGTGKSHTSEQLARVLDRMYGSVPMCNGATPAWLFGNETATGYKDRPFVRMFDKPGVFTFEEMDASDPGMLLVTNQALSNKRVDVPATGETILKHPDFLPVACMNTTGNGSNRAYSAREKQDEAMLDRWRAGMVYIGYDRGLMRKLLFGN